MLFHCPLYDEVRNHRILDRKTENAWTGFLDDEESFQLFRSYVTEVFSSRKKYLLVLNSSDSLSA